MARRLYESIQAKTTLLKKNNDQKPIKNPSSTNKTLKIVTITPDGIEHSSEFNSEKQRLEIDKFYNFSYEVTTKYKGNARIITPAEENSVFLK